MDRRSFLKLAGSILPALALEPARVVTHVVRSSKTDPGSPGFYIGNPQWDYLEPSRYFPCLDNFGISSASVRSRIVKLSETFGQYADRTELFKIAVMEEAIG